VRDQLEVFSDNLRRLRKERGFSQERLANAAGVHRTHISLIERGGREPGVRTVSKLARALEVSPAELFEDVERRVPG
jgi:transcriptional regulator with XRE-family HTH domain